MKKVLIFYALLVIAIVLFWFSRGSNLFNFGKGGSGGSSSVTAKVGTKTYKLLVAKTEEEKIKGLSDRDSLPSDTGMLFIFNEKGMPGFWMNKMKFPIDIIYIDTDHVVDFVENAPPPSSGQSSSTLPIYKPSSPANFVLEVNAKEVSKNKIKKGDKVTFKGVK